MLAERWQRNLAALWIAQALTMIAFSFVFPFFPLYIQYLGVRDTADAARWTGIIVAASSVSLALAQPFWGNLADRFGRRPMVLRSMIGGSVTILIMGLVVSVEQLLVVRFLQGAVTGTVSASNTLAATTTPRHRLGFALGAMQVALFVGTSVGPLLGGVVADTFGFRAAFFVAGALMMAGAAIVSAFVREDFTRPAPDSTRRGVWAESRALLAMSIFSTLVGVIFLIQWGNTVVSPMLSLFVAELTASENAATAAGIVLGATGVASAVSALVVGRLSDRMGSGAIVPVCLAGATLTCFPQAFVQQVWQLLLLRVLFGLFLGGLMPTANALVAQLVPQERRGAAFGLTATASSLAHAAGPLSGAAVVTQWGLRAVFLVTGLVFAVAYGWVAVSLRYQELPRPRPEASATRAEAGAPAGTDPNE